LLERSEATRPELSEATGLSKPTVSLAIAELESADLVVGVRRSQGATGRSATVYGLSSRSGWVIGLDLGSTHVAAAAWGLDGRVLDQERCESQSGARLRVPDLLMLGDAVARRVSRRVVKRRGRLVAAVAAVATTVPPQPDRVLPKALASTSTLVPSAVADALKLPRGTPLLFENNVNCAAVAEQRRGAARGRDSFAYLHVGLGVRLGAVIQGELLRGVNGAAGEVSLLPFPWAPGCKSRREALEKHLGSAGLLRRCRKVWSTTSGPVPSSPEQLLRQAAEGSDAARLLVNQHAEDIGRLVAAIAAVLDPGLVVLGGSIGENPLLLAGIRRTVRRLNGFTDVTVGQLGDDATVEGAALLATEHALDQLL
jgi:predicted NBD/HSP70 family sugar kinase